MKRIKLKKGYSFTHQGYCSAGETVAYKIAGANVFILADGFDCLAEISLQTFKKITNG